MKIINCKLAWFGLFLLGISAYALSMVVSVYAVSFPNPSGFVTDAAAMFSSQFRQSLEQNLSDFEKATGTEIAVATVASLEGMDIENYAVSLFEKWKIGKKGADNGLLLLIAKNDRQMRIEVGYGLEPYVTDGRAGDIIRQELTPRFKEGDFEGGTLAAVEKLKSYIGNKDVAPASSNRKNSSGDSPFWIIIVGGYFLITYLASFLGRTKAIWPGGVLGAVLGAVAGFILLPWVGFILGALGLGLFGLFLDFFLSKNYQTRKSRGLPTGFFTTFGGFKSGGGWGGGGGGFGGFGGGGSGGGGSSGRW